MSDTNNEELRAKEQQEQLQRDEEDRRRRNDEQAALAASAASDGVSSKSSSNDKSVKQSFISAHTNEKIRNNVNLAKDQSQKTVKNSKRHGKAVAEQSGSITDVPSPGIKAAVGLVGTMDAITSLQMSHLSQRMSRQKEEKDPASAESQAIKYQKIKDAAKMQRLKLMKNFIRAISNAASVATRTVGQHSRQKNNTDLISNKGRTDGASRDNFANIGQTGVSEREVPYIEKTSSEDDFQPSN